ncbi:MAG TPA: hypothetical protein VGF61_16335 [Candidatus Acidoferrum sp.]|jgi:hypothetical protein
MHIHFLSVIAGALLLASGTILSSQETGTSVTEEPLLSTGVTGSISASGLDDPQYVLSFVAIQRLMLDATRRPVTREEVVAAIQGTPVTLDRLLQLQLLRRDDDRFRLNYLLLTSQDQQAIYAASARYGQSLADAFRAHKAEFDQICSRYPNASSRPQLMFGLVAGAALNWGGLHLATQLGYRVQPVRHSNGDVYLIHSTERGVQLNLVGLYLDSETAPGSKMSFSTFGDGESRPRLQGLPDAFEGVDSAVEDWKKLPSVYGALRSEYVVLILSAIDDAGQIVSAVATGSDTDSSLAKNVSVPEQRRKSMLTLLTAIGYLGESGHRYSVGVPVLLDRDNPMVDSALVLSRQIMTHWLRVNYVLMEKELVGLSPMRNGLPFSLAFNEVWHYTFGFATKSLAETGFYANPYAPRNRYKGYVPLVWASSVLQGPGD